MISNQCNNEWQCNLHTCQTLDWKGSLRRGLLPRGNLRTWRGFWCTNIRGQSFSQNGKIILVQVFVTSESYGFSPSASLCPNPDPTALSSLLLPSLTPAPVQSASALLIFSISINIVNIDHQHQHWSSALASAPALSTDIISIIIVNIDHQHQYCRHRSSASASKSQTCQYMLVT